MFYIVYRLTNKSIFNAIPNFFFQILLYFFNNLSPFIKKDIYLVSSKTLLNALNFGRNIHKCLIFTFTFVTNEKLKSFSYQKEPYHMLLFHEYLHIVYWRFFVLVTFVIFNFRIAKIYNILKHFYIYFQIFFWFLLSLFKSAFWSEFIAFKLLF